MLRGEFVILGPGGFEEIVPNTVVEEGEVAFLDMIAKADNSIVAPSGSYFMGLMGDGILRTLDLGTIPGEPSATGGYARQAINRSATGWPTGGMINNIPFLQTQTKTFAATGVDYSVAVDRAFIASIVSGTTGTLFSISAAFAAPILVQAAVTGLSVAYRLYMR